MVHEGHLDQADARQVHLTLVMLRTVQGAAQRKPALWIPDIGRSQRGCGGQHAIIAGG
jgi:hypothetical protein